MSSGITSLPPLPYSGQLPIEIILHIISQLDHKQDRKTLSACSLINSSTQEDAQKYLFTSIKLVTIFKRERHPFLLEAICHNVTGSAIEAIINSTRLASYVRRLEIQLHNALAPDTASTDTEEAFPCVLRQFQHLQELSLYSNMIWSRLNETTTHSIQTLLKSNPLRTVYLRGNHAIPLEIMYDCSELRQLTIWAMTSLKEEGPADPTRSAIPLSSLMIRCPRDTEGLLTMSSILEHVQSPSCPLTLSSLTKFVVHQPVERARFIFLISTALSLCSSTLTHLTFPIPRSGRFPQCCLLSLYSFG
ncbi:hypothetical protein BJ165DRAFT_993700 [Panaeolus papilionaceus]|nr:hypothetical protein BJ165DRAFT_993700 [Panaeolus papilionaceus]